MSATLRRLRAPRTAIFLLFMALFIGGIVVLTGDVLRKLDRLGSATSDNVQWTLSQLEVDYLKLAASAQAAREGDAALEEFRRRFDIFYSRFNTIRSSPLYSSLHSSPGTPDRLTRIQGFLDDAIPLIDGPDSQLRAQIASLMAQINAIEQDVRQISISGITVFSSVSDEERERVAVTLLRVALAIGALVLLLLGAAITLSRAVRISEERAHELQDSSQRMQTIISTSLDAVVMADEHAQIIDIGGAASQLFGHDRADLMRMALTDLVEDEQIRKKHRWLSEPERINAFLGPGPSGSRRNRVRVKGYRADGETFPVEMSIGEAISSSGRIIVAYLRDISARIEAEQALTAARDNALVAARSKAEFLAVMSHEMRTPLGGLLGTMENLRDTELNNQQREWLDIMEASGRILLDHVNDVLDIAKLEAGKAALNTEAVDLAALLTQLATSQQSLAAQRGNRIELDLCSEAHTEVTADPARLRQIMLNLLGNAIKFTENGRIVLGLRMADGQEGKKAVELFVSDTGTGIPKDQQQAIFDDFVTLDSAYSRTVSGTGLGLGIVRRLVSVMGGEIRLESVERIGSRFSVALELAPAPSQAVTRMAPVAPGEAAPRRRCHVLLFEDNAINRRVIGHQLEALGHEVVMLEDGLKAEEVVAATRFDIILMDISMPRRDGIATTHAIRSAGLNQETPIIALTAHALPEEQQRFFAAGMQACLTKPVQRHVLDRTVNEWAAVESAEAAPAPSGQMASSAPAPSSTAPLVDQDHLADLRTELGADLFARLCEAAQKDGDALTAELAGLSASSEAGEVAHRLAGTAASFGARRLHATIASAEPELRADETPAQARQRHIDIITEIWSDTRAALATLKSDWDDVESA